MARRCRTRRKPYVDFFDAIPHISGNFAESKRYFYSPDGLHRLKKTGTMADGGRRTVLMSSDKEERELWMKEWGLM